MYEDRTVEDLQADNRLWPEAMLPAWFTADENLKIVHSNPFGFTLIEKFSLSHLLDGRLSIGMNHLPKGQESLWRSILSEDGSDNLQYMEFAISVLEQHRAVLDTAIKDGRPIHPEALMARLREVKGAPGVKPYVHSPRLVSPVLQIGVKVSPPQGLALLGGVSLEDGDLSFVDVVMAYRVLLVWKGTMLKSVLFRGAQPAIHDASERHRLWLWQREQKDAEISSLLSHAFKQPLATIARDLNDLQNTAFPMDRRNCIAHNVAIEVERVTNLVQLLNFVNSSDEIHFQLKLGVDDVVFSLAEAVNCLAKVLRRMHLNPELAIDKVKIQRMFAKAGLFLENKDPDPEDYKSLAEKLTSYEGIGRDAVFAIELTDSLNQASVQVREHAPVEVQKRIRTALLDLILNEMLVNAIKCASESAPEVALKFEFGSPQLAIEVFNNGATMTVEQFSSPADYLAPASGEKRKALGVMLNKRAAKVLGGVELKLGDPGPAGGTRLVLDICAHS